MRVTLTIFILLLVALTGVSGCASWTAEKRSPQIGQLVGVGGEKMHVLDAGPRDANAAPIILIHGASANLRDMKISLGDALTEEHRVIMVDRPGRGYSTRPNDGHVLARQAALIKAAVDELGVEQPIVVGQSLGGAVALRYALDFQDEISGLVLLAPVSHEWPGGVAWYNSVSQWPIAGFLLRRLVIPPYGQLSAEAAVKRSFAPDTPPENYYERSGLALLFRAHDFKANAADLANLKDEIIGQQDRYNELTLPVAIVTGTDDETVSPELHSKQLARDVNGATLTLLPDTGHALHHAETARIIEIIKSVEQQ